MIECIHGSKTTKVIEKEKTKEQEKFEDYITFYKNILMDISSTIKTLEELTKEDDKVDLFISYCPSFITQVYRNFWAKSVINFNELFRGDNSFKTSINYIQANWNNIYNKKWIDTIEWSNGDIEHKTVVFNYKYIKQKTEECLKLLEANRGIIDKIKTYRDKFYGHIDLDFDFNITLKLTELREMFVLAEKIFNNISGMYDRTHHCLEPGNSDDVKNLISVVKLYDKYHKKIRELDYNEKRNSIYKQKENEDNG